MADYIYIKTKDRFNCKDKPSECKDLLIYVFEYENVENINIMQRLMQGAKRVKIIERIKSISKKNIYESQSSHVMIANIGADKSILVSKSVLCGVKHKKTFFEYLLIAMADIIVISKVYNLKEAFDRLDFALELGKTICAIPGDILVYKNYFANYTIKQGAIPICNKYDMFNVITNDNCVEL